MQKGRKKSRISLQRKRRPLNIPSGMSHAAAMEAVSQLLNSFSVESIAGRHRAEVALQESELLLKEVHHRIKNNLQVIISLLNLQADASDDDKIKEFSRVNQARIHAMALVHEKLYISVDQALVDMQEYVQSLVDQLYISFGAPSNVNIEVSAPKVFLKMDLAVSCGLILNELICNAFKHAFKNEEKGELLIKLTVKSGDLFLTVADNGCGIPGLMEITKKKTFGLYLVAQLVEQLKGKWSVDGSSGAKIIVQIPPLEKASYHDKDPHS